MALELDLCCSESSADLSDDTATPVHSDWAPSHVLFEFRLPEPTAAYAEIERLGLIEQHSYVSAAYLAARGIPACARDFIVQTIFNHGTELGYAFNTSALAVNIFDRFLTNSPSNPFHVLTLVAAASLSIAGKLEELSCYRPERAAVLLGMASPACPPADLLRMELTVLAALGWRAMGVTAGNLVDPLIGLLELGHPALQWADGFEVAFRLREGCKHIMHSTLRDAEFLAFRPSTVAVSAIASLLERQCPPAACVAILAPLERQFSADRREEIGRCRQLMQPLVAGAESFAGAQLKGRLLEVSEDGCAVRLTQPSARSWTPTSVLDVRRASPPAVALAVPDDRPRIDYADWQLEVEKPGAGCEGEAAEFF